MTEPFVQRTALFEAHRAHALERFTIIRPALEVTWVGQAPATGATTVLTRWICPWDGAFVPTEDVLFSRATLGSPRLG